MTKRKRVKHPPNSAKNACNLEAVESKEQTNAFKLMMDSRIKFKETYSPPRNIENNEDKYNLNEKHIFNEKRNLTSSETDEEETFKIKEKKLLKKESIKVKLVNRKKVFKRTLIKDKETVVNISKINKIIPSFTDVETKDDLKTIEKTGIKNGDLHLNNKCEKILPNVVCEDKKENIYGYFKKIDKKSNTCEEKGVKSRNSNSFCNEYDKGSLVTNTTNVVKSKELEIKNQHEKKEKESPDFNNSPILNRTQLSNPYKKRKRKLKTNNLHANSDTKKNNEITDPEKQSGSRPKRNVKKPLKYVDNMCTSDEDEPIFTPKKRKQIEKKTKPNYTGRETSPLGKICKGVSVKNLNKEEVFSQIKKAPKLAPIFKPKSQLNPEELNAKQLFLQSGFPEQLKKNRTPSVKHEADFQETLPVVVHVQQINHMPFVATVERLIDIFYENEPEINYSPIKYFRKTLISSMDIKLNNDFPFIKNSPHELLKDIKEAHPEFPVFRTYNSLKGRRRESGILLNQCLANETSNNCALDMKISSHCLPWTDKYKATSTSNLMGNIEAVKELKKWLTNWTETQTKGKNCASYSSDLSDFYDSDKDCIDVAKLLNNLFILSGPTGSGKTSSVYVVASELAIKVIEVNVSSKRTGKSMLQDLREATQSHKIDGRTNLFERNTKSYRSKENKINLKGIKRHSSETSAVISIKGNIDKDNEQDGESARTSMSLILIDDADIVFEEDDGFLSAITQLVYSSKRPVVLTTSSIDCPHLQKFLHHSKVLLMKPYFPKKLGIWLDVLCIVDTGFYWPGLGSKVLDFYKGDIRKTINYLQFYMIAQKHISSENVSQIEKNDNYSNVTDQIAPKCFTSCGAAVSHCVTNNQQMLGTKNVFNLWWSIPRLLQTIFDPDRKATSEYSQVKQIKAVSNLIDTISFTDFLNNKIKQDNKLNLISEPWKLFETDFVSEFENQDMFNGCKENIDIIAEELVIKSIIDCQKSLNAEENVCSDFPGMNEQQLKDRIVSRHTNLNSLISPSNALDRKALALDYWPACRTLCRVESSKAKITLKRHNRYCHYLKTLSASCKNEFLDHLGESLTFNQNIRN